MYYDPVLNQGVDLRLVIDSAKPIKHKKIVTFNQVELCVCEGCTLL